jgi:hypothetical protein
LARSTSIAVLLDYIRSHHFQIELEFGIGWIFLKRPDFTLTEFGDVAVRDKFLGKWIATFPAEKVIAEATRILHLIHKGQIKLVKFNSFLEDLKRDGAILVYCLDRDPKIEVVLRNLGWSLSWKYNSQTFEEPG